MPAVKQTATVGYKHLRTTVSKITRNAIIKELSHSHIPRKSTILLKNDLMFPITRSVERKKEIIKK